MRNHRRQKEFLQMPLFFHYIRSYRSSRVPGLERTVILARRGSEVSGDNCQVISITVLTYLHVLPHLLVPRALTSIPVHLYASIHICSSMLFLNLRHLFCSPEFLPSSLLVITPFPYCLLFILVEIVQVLH